MPATKIIVRQCHCCMLLAADEPSVGSRGSTSCWGNNTMNNMNFYTSCANFCVIIIILLINGENMKVQKKKNTSFGSANQVILLKTKQNYIRSLLKASSTYRNPLTRIYNGTCPLPKLLSDNAIVACFWQPTNLL